MDIEQMKTQLLIVKTASPVAEPVDVLDLDNDPAFKADDYQKLAEQLGLEATWNGDEGGGSLFGHPAALVSTDAGLFVSCHALLTTEQLDELNTRAIASSAVVIDADSAETLSGNLDL
jgi:hypothetical protein